VTTDPSTTDASVPTPMAAPERQAREKFHCPACGAETTWDPTAKTLLCAYCGTPAPSTPGSLIQGTPIQEHDLALALDQLPDSARGWNAKAGSVRCQSCNAISVFEAEHAAKRCDFCGSAALIPYQELRQSIRPESLLPLRISEAQVRDSLRTWYSKRWFAPSNLGDRALTDTVHGVYLPYWTFDAQADARWTALSGYYYYTTESYTDANGRTQTRQVRHTRWVPSAGSVSHFFDDELVSGSQGVRADLLRRIEPFPTAELVPYHDGFVAGWTVERYQIDLVKAATAARQGMADQVRSMCASRVPGDTHMNLQVSIDWSGQTFKHILVPVWLLTYDYGRKSYQVAINGYTGSIAGDRPYSFLKIFFAVLAVILFMAVVAWFGEDWRFHR
jgi:ribosomal protein S27E